MVKIINDSDLDKDIIKDWIKNINRYGQTIMYNNKIYTISFKIGFFRTKAIVHKQ